MKNIVVLLSGKQGSGKSTLSAGIFQHFLDSDKAWVFGLKFADPLYAMHEAIWNALAQYGVTRPSKIDGPLMQMLGTEWGRKCHGQDFWVKVMLARLNTMIQQTTWRHRVIIIDDARFLNEIEILENDEHLDVIKIRLEAGEHIRRTRAEKWRPDTRHASEIGLDDYQGFHRIIFTDTCDQKETLRQAVELIEKVLQ